MTAQQWAENPYYYSFFALMVFVQLLKQVIHTGDGTDR